MAFGCHDEIVNRMSSFPAKLVLAASTALLVGVGMAFASAPDPRSDLAGRAVRRTPPTQSDSAPTAAASTTPAVFLGGRRSEKSNRAELETVPSTIVKQAPRSVPLRLMIPSLDLDAPVVSVGIEPDNSMQIPGASEAGWYRFGPQPGDAEGSAVVAGHVDHAGQPGVFLDLREVEVGADIFVTDNDGEQHQFQVAERYQVDKDELPAPELFRTTGEPVLTLITCGGSFSKSERSYSDNIVVRAVPVPLVINRITMRR
jgi:LPXTG-site transpeptidase (sortase) family protein